MAHHARGPGFLSAYLLCSRPACRGRRRGRPGPPAWSSRRRRHRLAPPALCRCFSPRFAPPPPLGAFVQFLLSLSCLFILLVLFPCLSSLLYQRPLGSTSSARCSFSIDLSPVATFLTAIETHMADRGAAAHKDSMCVGCALRTKRCVQDG